MRLRVLISLLLALSIGVALSAQNKKGGKKKKGADDQESNRGPAYTELNLTGRIPGNAISDSGRQSDWPVIAYASDGALWSAWVEWNDKDADRIMVRRRSAEGQWGEAFPLADGNWDHYAPALTSLPKGRMLAVWPAQTEGNFELYSAELAPASRTAKPQRLTRAPFSDFNVRSASDAKGNAIIVWQSFRAGNSDVYARWFRAGRWGAETLISSSGANDWEPAVALDAAGTAWISWDNYEHGNYDVLLRAFGGNSPGVTIPITTEPTAQFHSTVAASPDGSVWVAWDDAGINWGKDFSRSSAAPGSLGLHHSRSVGMRVYSGGKLYDPDAPLRSIFSGRMSRYAELPHLAFDGAGALVLVFRHWTYAQPHEIYHFYATRLEGGDWSLPYQLSNSSGPNSQRAVVVNTPEGAVAIGYSSDGRSATNLPTSQEHALHYVTYVSDFPKGARATKVALNETKLPAAGSPTPRRQRLTMTNNGTKYTLMLGDSHRHTDIRGHSGIDGSVLDTYRYAIDAAQLDFLGTSDHNEVTGGKWPDGLRDYQWWYVQKDVDLFTHSPVFTGVYSYEHSMTSPGGHRNVLFLKRGAPLRRIDRTKGYDAPDNSPPAMWAFWERYVLSQPGQKSVIIPHTFGAGPLADWNWPNARFDCLLEMYQGARGSYEAWQLPDNEKRGPTQTDQPGHFARDALAKGNTYGFVSFSDHGSTHNSWAAVWVTEENRNGLLDGMYARRTYAASDEIMVRATADAHMPGEEWEAAVGQAPVIKATIDAPETLLRIDVVKDGNYVYTTRPNARSATIEFRDRNTKPGRSYYYIRAFQRDPEAPDGDPEIAWISPFYVTYR